MSNATYEDLKDKVVIVTGGSNGIGRAMVEAFAKQEAKVHFCDIDADAGKPFARDLGEKVEFHKVDLTKIGQVQRWIDNVARAENRIDILINNAARDPRIALDAMTTNDWDKLFALNIRAFMITAQRASKYMKKGSSIVNFSSVTFHLSQRK